MPLVWNCAPRFSLDSTGNTVFGLCCLYHLHKQRAQNSSAAVSFVLRSSFFLDFSTHQNRKQSHERTQDGEAFHSLGFSHDRRIATTWNHCNFWWSIPVDPIFELGSGWLWSLFGVGKARFPSQHRRWKYKKWAYFYIIFVPNLAQVSLYISSF